MLVILSIHCNNLSTVCVCSEEKRQYNLILCVGPLASNNLRIFYGSCVEKAQYTKCQCFLHVGLLRRTSSAYLLNRPKCCVYPMIISGKNFQNIYPNNILEFCRGTTSFRANTWLSNLLNMEALGMLCVLANKSTWYICVLSEGGEWNKRSRISVRVYCVLFIYGKKFSLIRAKCCVHWIKTSHSW